VAVNPAGASSDHQPDHGAVLGQDGGGYKADASLGGEGGEGCCEAAAETDALVVVPDQQRQLGPVPADDKETAQGDDGGVAVLGGGSDRPEPLVSVDGGEVFRLPARGPGFGAEIPQVAGRAIDAAAHEMAASGFRATSHRLDVLGIRAACAACADRGSHNANGSHDSAEPTRPEP
jgi:hypothetical protein